MVLSLLVAAAVVTGGSTPELVQAPQGQAGPPVDCGRALSDQAIGQFCQKNFDVSFPLFTKIEVNGDNAHPLYAWLKHEAAGLLGTEAIKWNFTKFLVDRNGKVVHRYASATRPDELVEAIDALL